MLNKKSKKDINTETEIGVYTTAVILVCLAIFSKEFPIFIYILASIVLIISLIILLTLIFGDI